MILKRLATTLSLATMMLLSANAGAPPTIMILPDQTWCNTNGYVTRSMRNGKERVSENYDEAFLNEDLKNVVTALNDLLAQKRLPPKSYIEASEIDDDEEAEEELFEGAESGAGLEGNAYEQALNKLKPDIILKVGWTLNGNKDFNYNLSYRLDAIDSYSGKSIATVTAETPNYRGVRFMPLAAALKNAATEHMDNFTGKLIEHFEDIQENGREITLTLRIIGNGNGVNFNTEYGDKELNEIISDWLADNTVNHRFSLRNGTRNRLQFEQIRIPMKKANSSGNDAKSFVTELNKYLKNNYSIRAENATKGLGSGRLYIGEK